MKKVDGSMLKNVMRFDGLRLRRFWRSREPKTRIGSTKKLIRKLRSQLIRKRRKFRDSNIDRRFRLDKSSDDHTNRESSSCCGNIGGRSSINCRLSMKDKDKESMVEVEQEPKRLLLRKESLTFKIHEFVHCSKQRGQYCLSPALQAHGYSWRLQLYPRGHLNSNGTVDHVSCFLHYFASSSDKQTPCAKVEYICGTYKTETQICDFAIDSGKRSCCWGLENFIRRDRVIRNCLDQDGALTVEVKIQLAIDQKTVWYPPIMTPEPTLSQLYDSVQETGDAAFRVTSSNTKRGRALSRSKLQPISKIYRAHKMILAVRARILYELVCEESLPEDEEEECDDNAVDLPGVDSQTFEAMLRHIYTIQQPNIQDEETAMKLLVLSDRFCLTDLKMYIESVLVDRFVSPSNAASMLLFADSHSCALLKEKLMDMYTNDPNSVTCTASWPLVQESQRILHELSKHTHTSTTLPTCQEETEFCQLDVFSLRERLIANGLPVDGSRQTLIGRLKNIQVPEKARPTVST